MLYQDIIKKVVYETIPENIIEYLIIFGSRARGESTTDSDTDICIILKEDLPREDIKRYRIALSKIFAFDYHMATDIIIKSSYTYNRYKNIIGALEYDIANEGIKL